MAAVAGVLLLAVCLGFAAASGLRDNPIVGDATTYLDGVWTLEGSGLFCLCDPSGPQ